ncbi:MAG: protein kinase [Gemmataceae bacterium]
MSSAIPTLDTVFCEAVEIADAADRAAHIARACGCDDALRRRVEALVEAHFRAGSFLEHPAATPGDTAEPGDMIGPYRLLERVGEGGMGVVYVAEQTKPVRRQVALKVIKPGMDTAEVIARFEAERQALALMDHPNIAKIFDGGSTGELGVSTPRFDPSDDSPRSNRGDDSPRSPSGRPYFVMELVRGLPITDYCDQAKLPADRRLRLFAQVCRAVEHAHQKGVIHRDLKPSNVLVTLHDGEPVPKVIDFGVAKAIDQQLTDKAVYTRLTQMVGTPMYMAPEQAELSGLDIDTRSDVYSLGVLLYELLTGTTPFDADALRAAGFDEMRRMIREDEPPRPSARVSTLDAEARSTAAGKRGLDDRQFSRVLRGDLDWIVMKALEKDRSRRYESAGAFAADVERYLADEPVGARPPSAAYRLQKFTRRHRVGVFSGLAVAVALSAIGGGFGYIAHNRDVRQAAAVLAAHEALADADRAEQAARWREAQEATKRAAGLLDGAGGNETLRKTVERRLDDLAKVLRVEDIRLKQQLSTRTSTNDGPLEIFLGDKLYTAAFREFDIDVDALEPEEVARRLPQGEARAELVAALDDWARNRRMPGGKGERDWRRILAAAQCADPDPWRNRLRDAWARRDQAAMREMATTASNERLHPSSLKYLATASDPKLWISLLVEAQRRRPGDFGLNVTLAVNLMGRGDQASMRESLPYYRAALAVQPDNAYTMRSLANTLSMIGNLDDALGMYEQVLRVDPKYAEAHAGIGRTLSKKGKFDEAVTAFRKAISLNPRRGDYYADLAKTLARMSAWQEAAEALDQANRLMENAHTLCLLGYVLEEMGQPERALDAYRRGHERGSKGQNWFYPSEAWVREFEARIAAAKVPAKDVGTRPPTDPAAKELARIRAEYRRACLFDTWTIRPAIHLEFAKKAAAIGAWDDAISAYRLTLRMAPDDATALNGLAWIVATCPQVDRRDPDEAVRLASRAIVRMAFAGSAWNTLGVAQYRAGNWQGARAALEKSMQLSNGGDGHDWFVLAMAHWQLGDRAKARELFDLAERWIALVVKVDDEIARFRTEAAELLGVPVKPLR